MKPLELLTILLISPFILVFAIIYLCFYLIFAILGFAAICIVALWTTACSLTANLFDRIKKPNNNTTNQ